MFPSSSIGYAVGNLGTIIKTMNGGTNWSVLSSGTQYDLSSVYFIDANTGYVAGSGGTILATIDGGGLVGVNENKPVSNTLKLYPNPAFSKLSIKTVENGNLFLFDFNGVLLLQREITEPTATIDINTLPYGIYLVKLVSVKNVQVGKFIKQ
jgi:photosystem II stability/assembly factor-like uncharacterized protein